jgi:hypothetical protein
MQKMMPFLTRRNANPEGAMRMVCPRWGTISADARPDRKEQRRGRRLPGCNG